LKKNIFWDMASRNMFFQNIETSYQTAQRHDPDDSFHFRHRCENLKSYYFNIMLCYGGN
jgi:hypothetical protein